MNGFLIKSGRGALFHDLEDRVFFRAAQFLQVLIGSRESSGTTA
jgi:hypothetical protein